MKRKEKSKIICKHISRKIFGYKDNENVYVATVMDALKEIEDTKKKDEYDEITVRYNEGSINHTISILGWKGERSYSLLEDTDNSCVTVITKDTFKMKQY